MSVRYQRRDKSINIAPSQRQRFNKQTLENENEILEKNVSGIVKWFNLDKGFGYIQRKDKKNDVYVGSAGLSKEESGKIKCLQKQDEVNFDIAKVDKRKEAVNIVSTLAKETYTFRIAKSCNLENECGVIQRNKTNQTAILLKSDISNCGDDKYKIVERNVSGIVKWFKSDKGFGYIERKDKKKDVYVGSTGLPKDRFGKIKCVHNQDEVNFDIAVAEKGKLAVNVVVTATAVIEKNVFGVVKSFNLEKGYGVIQRKKTNQTAIVLKSDITNRGDDNKCLQRDEKVRYDIVITSKIYRNQPTFKAINVEAIIGKA